MSDYAQSLVYGLKSAYKAYVNLYRLPFDFSGTDFTKPTELYKRFAEITSDKRNLIGAVQSLEILNERATNVWRELDTATAGRPVESYPGLPEYRLRLSRIALYDSLLTDALYDDKDDSLDISKQNSPLLLQVTLKCVDDDKLVNPSSDQLKTKVWYLYDVWFLESSLELGVDNTDDIKIIQESDALAAGIVGDK